MLLTQLNTFSHDTGMLKKPFNLKTYIQDKLKYMLFGWECCPAWKKFASIVELFIMDAFVDLFITVCIIVNTAFMALDYEGMSEKQANVLAVGNYVIISLTTFIIFI